MPEQEKLYFRIADLVFELESDLSFPIPPGNSACFRIPEEDSDFSFRLEKTDNLSECAGRLQPIDDVQLGFEFINDEGCFVRGFVYKEKFYDAVFKSNEGGGVIYYPGEGLMVERFQTGFDVVNFFCLEYIFLRRGGLFLHSSHLNVGGKALLFSAPSGTGKSTQADLWHAATGAEIINGDRSLLRKKDGVWHAYGCPMCGTSGIHRQGDEPVHAIVMLEQGKENALRRLGAAEAFSLLYPQVTIPKWSRELVLRGMELLDSVIAEVPVYHYSCTKTEDAVTTLRSALGL